MKEGVPHKHVPQYVELEPFQKISMDEAATRIFIESRGVEPLANWQPHKPLIYLLPEDTRIKDNFGDLPPQQVPSIAHIYDPEHLDLKNSPSAPRAKELGLEVYPLITSGRVDYYAIDSVTKAPILVKVTKNSEDSRKYYVVKENLYEANDELFPPR